MEGFTNGSGCHFLKEIFDQVRKDLDCELFIQTKTSGNLIIFTIYADNIHRVRKR